MKSLKRTDIQWQGLKAPHYHYTIRRKCQCIYIAVLTPSCGIQDSSLYLLPSNSSLQVMDVPSHTTPPYLIKITDINERVKGVALLGRRPGLVLGQPGLEASWGRRHLVAGQTTHLPATVLSTVDDNCSDDGNSSGKW